MRDSSCSEGSLEGGRGLGAVLFEVRGHHGVLEGCVGGEVGFWTGEEGARGVGGGFGY